MRMLTISLRKSLSKLGVSMQGIGQNGRISKHLLCLFLSGSDTSYDAIISFRRPSKMNKFANSFPICTNM